MSQIIDRRNALCILIASGALPFMPNYTFGSAIDPIKAGLNASVKINLSAGADFGFKLEGGRLSMAAKDVRVNIPHIGDAVLEKFSWGWVGTSIASSVLSGVGGMIVGALFNSIFGGSNGQEDLTKLLNRQFEEFVQVVGETVENNSIREYQGKLQAYLRLFREYSNQPTMASLEMLKHDSAVLLSMFETLGFKGYRSYMICAGLRLAILQEYMKINKPGARVNFEEQRDASVTYHNNMFQEIHDATNPLTYTKPYFDNLDKSFHHTSDHAVDNVIWRSVNENVEVKTKILGNTTNFTIHCIDRKPVPSVPLNKIRDKLMHENWYVGYVMAKRWQAVHCSTCK